MALTVGDPLPSITSTATRADVAPDYYTDYLKALSGAGETGMGLTAAQGVAPMDLMQISGYGKVPAAADAYKTGLTSAGTTADIAAGGLQGTRIGELMDPYQKYVTDEMARLQQQNIQRSVLPSLRGAFVGRGDLGSQRYAAATGQTLADMQRNLVGQQYGALSTGYQNALKAAMDELDLQNRAAQTQATIAQKEQELGLLGAGALTKAGAEKQAFEQAKLDYPLKQATTAAALMRGFQIPTTQTTTEVGPKTEGYYQKSPLQQILGVLSTLGAIRGGSTGDKALGGAFDFLKSKFPGSLDFSGAGYSGPQLTAEEAAEYFGLAQGGLASINRRD
jgi:hypothetical protein